VPAQHVGFESAIEFRGVRHWRGNRNAGRLLAWSPNSFETLLNILEFLTVILEFSEQLLGTTALDNQRAFVGLAHSVFPEFIDGHELVVS
jgi:hypothetical protein